MAESKKEIFDKEKKEKADHKISKDNWLRASMMIEVLAKTEEATRSALEQHVESMAKEKMVIMYKKDYSEIQRIENPLRNRPEIKEAFSYLVEVEMAVKRYESLISIVMSYGPSSVEILEPNKLQLDLGEAQGIVNSVGDLMHKFIAAGVGGVVIKS